MPRVGVIGVPDGWSSKSLTEAFRERTGFGLLVDMGGVAVDFDAGVAEFDGVDLCVLDGLVIKKVGATYSPDLMNRLDLLRYVEARGPRVFSRPASIKHVLDRLSCTVTLQAAGIPMPATVVTESLELAERAVSRLGSCVLKPIYTSKARGMVVVSPGPELSGELERFRAGGNPFFYIQQMVELPGKDLGLAFLGGQFVGCYARVRQGDAWCTTTHSGGKYEPHEPAPHLIDLAHKAQGLFDLDFTSVDIAETADGPVVFEVSAFGGFRGLLEASDIDAAGLYADYVLERIRQGEGRRANQ